MILGILTLLSALSISAVAIYYSVAGLAAIFAAAVIPIIIMGVTLEVGKLVTAVWLHKNWSKATWWLRSYLAVAVFILMFITSMGIFGYLSKAHIEQTSLSQEQVALIETLNDKEARSENKISRWTEEMNKLMKGEDVRVDNLIDREQKELDKINALIKEEKDDVRVDFDKQIQLQNDRIEQARIRKEADIKAAKDRFEGSLGGGAKYDKAVEEAKSNELSVASSAQREIRNINAKLNDALAAVDSKYAPQIADINKRIQDLRNQANNKTQDIDGRIEELEGFIDAEQTAIDQVRDEKFEYEKEYRKLEAEVGPIKYIAEFIYGEDADQNLLEAAVRWVIIIIIFVFDPLAVLLLIASQYTFNWMRDEKGNKAPPPKPDPEPEPSDPTPGYTEDEWDQAHKENEEFDAKRREQARAEKIANNIPPEIENANDKVTSEDVESMGQGQEEQSTEIELDDNREDNQEEEQREDETREEYLKRIWKKEHPESTIEHQKRLKGEGQINSLPWEDVDHTIEDMKNEGEWPKAEEDDLDKWNDWVEKANKEAEENPEDRGSYTEVIEPQGFVQNEEQNKGIWKEINSKRDNVDTNAIKELEITEERYRESSQKRIAELVQRIKEGSMSIDDVEDKEKDKILKALQKR